MADDLTELFAGASTTMPAPVTWASPEQIRRIGTRRRHRNQIVIATALVLAIAAGVTTAYRFLGDRPDSPPIQPSPSVSQLDTLDVPERVMLPVDVLPAGFTVEDSVTGGPTGPDGLPEGWRGDSQWYFFAARCDAFHTLNPRGYYARLAIRITTYQGPDRSTSIDEAVERYPTAEAAARVMADARAVLDVCGSSDFRATGRIEGFAGDDSLRFVANIDGRATDWIVVRAGNLIAMLVVPHEFALDPSVAMAVQLCEGLSTC